MKDFTNINFKWKFRDYQQRVLDNASKFLLDGKINIVAAPGSGKTILGLELIRRLNNACIIFSPTTTIREQWIDRFKESFLSESQNIDDYCSNDLNKIKLINSITYQALYSTINKIAIEDDDEIIDYSNIDLFNLLKEKNIKTICLDEAHHLKNEWQKALEKFISGLNKDVKVISLTATPPYDSTSSEWERYIKVSGEIDDEIFVPELVKQKTLCPHQDYILFNYPSKEEVESLYNYKDNAFKALNEIFMYDFIKNINNRINEINKINTEYIYENAKGIIALGIILNCYNLPFDNKIIKKLTGSKNIPLLELKYAERALQFLLDDNELLKEEEKNKLIIILKKYSLISRSKVKLELSDKLKKSLISSVGKLESIVRIVKLENEVLKDKLRLLILTDYIKKEEVINIGSNITINNISIVSIFESLRRSNLNIEIGCLSGSLVILPNNISNILQNEFSFNNFTFKEIANTDYSIYNFKGNNKIKVEIVSKLFLKGYIKVLIGTQSLLGEGWDSPCINSLILASYVGSFMLSNQMRGRAIRIFKEDPLKTSNIWHLVTIEPEYVLKDNIIQKISSKISYDKNKLISSDFETLKKRFDCFVGPNYEENEIESGIERITYIAPPFDKENIEKINDKMLNKAKDRQGMSSIWNDVISIHSRTIIENRIPKENAIPVITFNNIIGIMLATSFQGGMISGLSRILINLGNLEEVGILALILALIIYIIGLVFTIKFANFIIRNSSPNKSLKNIGKAILKSLKELDYINEGARLNVNEDSLKSMFSMSIKNATIHEQNIFNNAIYELLSPIDNPKYMLIKKNFGRFYDYTYSFSCPSIFNSSNIEILKDNLNKTFINLEIVYAYNLEGRKIMHKARKKSFIYQNKKMLSKRQKVSKYD